MPNTRAISLGLLLFVLASACQREEPPQPPRESKDPRNAGEEISRKRVPSPLTVATYNVNWGNKSFPQLAETLKESGATIVALQETRPELERYLQIQLANDYRFQHYAGFRGVYFGERFGLLSRVPFRSMRFEPPRHGLFGFLSTEFAWDGRVVKLINVHLDPFDVSGSWSIFRQIAAIESIHQLEITEVLGQTKSDQPTLIVGDFNSPSAFAAPKKVREQGFQDSFAWQHKSLAEADKHPTWHWPIGKTELKLRIDYIFHDGHWKTRESRLAEFEFSDHRMLISTLELMDRATEKQDPDDKP